MSENKQLLRFIVAGSVDDGKSTLIGRLLYDSDVVQVDLLEALAKASNDSESFNLALLTDGLKAEREQGITIDVAYKYFSTDKRKFIIADAPGHVQYTRNMVTGASTAHLAIILIDARKGVIEQTRRHSYIASLLGIRHFVLCVNKMDLEEYSEEVFRDIENEFHGLAKSMNVPEVQCIPVSALSGDNIVHPSEKMPWYEGPSLLHFLETVETEHDENLTHPRFPIQYIIRPHSHEHHDYRGYAGRIASGVFRKGDEIEVLPSGLKSKIKKIDTFDGEKEEAFAPMSVTILLEDDIDAGRGNVLVSRAASVSQEFKARLCWMTEEPLNVKSRFILRHTTSEVRAMIGSIHYRLNIHDLTEEHADNLALNDIGQVTIRTSEPVVSDPYQLNRRMGSFILVDEASNNTVAAGMIENPA